MYNYYKSKVNMLIMKYLKNVLATPCLNSQ